MNAIVALCHFCEAHGPRALFCTYSESGTDVATAATPVQSCAACGSLGAETVLSSRTEDGCVYYSRESIPNADITAIMRQAAIRSLTCEATWSSEGGCVYFSEGPSHHVLSCSFQLSDSRSRGLRRWFSSIVLMKDRLQLLNLLPFFSKHMQERASELKRLTAAVFDEEQKICSQRALRLNTGRNDFGPSRSLQQLTGENNIFHKLHMAYSWMLHAGARTYTETIHTSRELWPSLEHSSARDVSAGQGDLRAVRLLVGVDVFRTCLYCTLTGIKLIVKSNKPEHEMITRTLVDLIPACLSSSPTVRFLSKSDVVQPAAGTCVVEDVGHKFECVWPGNLPSKCPTLMTRIENAMNSNKLTDAALNQHLKTMRLQWLGIATTLKKTLQSSGYCEAVTKLKQVLGIAPHDELLVNHWMQTFCTSC